ncbi:hypothetical protein [Inhella gelatinilytica]|uniref:SnoaL-like domain-containing protein n=1 Tax=Inhella gelatinilytica TaxID=2795030 RepID=A0A931N9I5_9BURK|nr:hypothetical protein [Inhella gelatinilytica]MBH9551403.1 hypothetical protein [Inhella gelatinilytica]
MQASEVEAFFAAYAADFSALDGQAVASRCSVPLSIAHAGGVTAWTDAEPLRANMLALCEIYRGAGLSEAVPLILETVPLGPDDGFVLVRWTLRRADASVLQVFRTGYQLKRLEGAWRVVFVTAFEENLQALKRAAAAP